MRSLEAVELTTARLRLRPLGDRDALALFAIYSDPRVMRYWSSPPWDSLETAKTSIANDVADRVAGAHLRLGIEHPEQGLLGTCTLFGIQRSSRRAELGYALASPHWGNGFMQEALGALIGHGFGALALNRLEADIDPRNAASAKTLQRLGFRLEGHLRERWIVAGEVSDSDLYGLLCRDWAARPEHAETRACLSDERR